MYKKRVFRQSLVHVGLLGILASYQNCGGGFRSTQIEVVPLSSLSVATPQIQFDLKPSDVTNQSNAEIKVSSTGNYPNPIQLMCKIKPALVFSTCSTPISLTNLPDAVHEIDIKAIDTVTGAESSVLHHTWTKDSQPPTVSLNQVPAATVGVAQASLSFSAVDTLSGVASFECMVDGAAAAPCTSPLNLTNLAAGAHQVSVRAIDKAKNISAVANANWTIIFGIPTVMIQGSPPAIGKQRSVSVSFNGVDGQNRALSLFECRVNNGSFASCTSPATYSNLTDGSYLFDVRGKDSSGVTSSPVSASWVVDATLPTVSITASPPVSLTVNTASYVFTVSESGSGLKSTTCQLDSVATEACSTMKTYSNLTAGSHTFLLKAEDNAGNVAQATHSFTYTPPAPPPITDGRLLYANICAACHRPLETTVKAGRTAEQITTAIGSIPQMMATPAVVALSADQIKAIAAVLATTSTPASPFSCPQEGPAPLTQSRLMTKREYINSARDLFNGRLDMAQLQTELGALPAEATKNLFDTMSTNISPERVDAYSLLADRIATLMITNAAWLTDAMDSTCAQKAYFTSADACLTKFLNQFGRRAYKRDLTSSEISFYRTLYDEAGSTTDMHEGLDLVIRVVLQAPEFLYRLELGETAISGQASTYSLSAYELASRLSYLAWGSLPDTTLLDAAKSGVLASPSGYLAQLNRLFADSKSKENVRSFYNQWLGLDRLSGFAYSASYLNGLTSATLRTEIIQEADEFMNHLVWKNGNYTDLMTSKLAYIRTQNLAKIYNTSMSATPDVAVTLSESQRGGILGRAAMNVGGSDKQPIVHRGVVVRRYLLCDEIPDPDPSKFPPGSLTPPVPDPLDSLRTQLEKKTSSEQCQACHSKINPVSFALGNFDSLGRYQTQEKVLDAQGVLVATHNIDVSVADPNIDGPGETSLSGATALSTAISKSNKGPACMAKQWFTYNMSRKPTTEDDCVMLRLYQNLSDAKKVSSTGDTAATILNMLKSLPMDPNFKLIRKAP